VPFFGKKDVSTRQACLSYTGSQIQKEKLKGRFWKKQSEAGRYFVKKLLFWHYRKRKCLMSDFVMSDFYCPADAFFTISFSQGVEFE